jgi:hypothetical protein
MIQIYLEKCKLKYGLASKFKGQFSVTREKVNATVPSQQAAGFVTYQNLEDMTQNCFHQCVHSKPNNLLEFLEILGGSVCLSLSSQKEQKVQPIWVSLSGFEPHWWIISQNILKGSQAHGCVYTAYAKMEQAENVLPPE